MAYPVVHRCYPRIPQSLLCSPKVMPRQRDGVGEAAGTSNGASHGSLSAEGQEATHPRHAVGASPSVLRCVGTGEPLPSCRRVAVPIHLCSVPGPSPPARALHPLGLALLRARQARPLCFPPRSPLWQAPSGLSRRTTGAPHRRRRISGRNA